MSTTEGRISSTVLQQRCNVARILVRMYVRVRVLWAAFVRVHHLSWALLVLERIITPK
jgi:hypothetical protein